MLGVPDTFLNPPEPSPFVPGYGNQFERKRPIGYGSSGVVWEAYDHKLHRSVAIKFISGATPAELSSLKNEARIASGLQHPGIVTIHDAHFEGETPSIVMSLVNGPTLQELMQTGIGQAQALDILEQAAQALNYAHTKGTVHRDVKPANIMLHEKSKVMITDFGIARQHLATHVTLPGWMKGTPAYMSPEQRAANPETHPVTPRSDQFSLAIVAYEMLTGHRPAPDRLKAGDGKAGERVFRRALSARPEDRYGSCTDFVKALRFALNPWFRRGLFAAALVPLLVLVAWAATQFRAPSAPSIVSFRVLPSRIHSGEGAALIWQVSNASQVTIDPEIGKVEGVTMQVHPATGVTYRLTAVGPGGQISQFASLEVVPPQPTAPPPPVIRSFHADPSTVKLGQTFKLRWHVENATSLAIDRGIGPVTGEESAAIVATESTSFILTASRPGSDVVTNIATVTVTAPGEKHATPP
jgi:serine/threonine protein kinase